MKRKTPATTAPTVLRTARRRRRRPLPTAEAGDATAPGRARRAPAPPRGALPVGFPERLGPYRLLEILGEGGMGTVFLAEETENLRRQVAVKWIRAALVGEPARLRFAAERRALARMNHPSIAQIFEAGTDDEGRPYIVMEHVAGGRITEYCQRHEPPLQTVLALLTDLARGLLHAHRHGILHRDIKPSNVLVREDVHEGPMPKIIDFGLAKLLDATVQLTRPGDVLGTPAYMPPEQLRGDPVDPRTDIYAFGVLVREVLTGDPEGALSSATSAPGLLRLVDTCVAPDPADRYNDVAALLVDLEKLKAESAAPSSEASSEARTGDLRRVFEADAGSSARRLLEIFEEAAARSDEELRRALAEAGHQRDVSRRMARFQDQRIEATAEYHLGAALQGGVWGDPDEDAAACFERALNLYQQVVEALPARHALDYVYLGDLLLHLAETDGEEVDRQSLRRAAEAYGEALALDGKLASARYGLALAGLLGHAEAMEWMGDAWRILELDPESVSANNHLGVVLFESHHHPEISLYGHDKLREAVATFEKVLELDPARAAIHFNLGLVLLAQGKAEEAEKSFRRAGENGLEGGRPRLILPYVAESVDEDPSDVDLLMLRGQALAKEDAEAARKCFVRAERLLLPQERFQG